MKLTVDTWGNYNMFQELSQSCLALCSYTSFWHLAVGCKFLTPQTWIHMDSYRWLNAKNGLPRVLGSLGYASNSKELPSWGSKHQVVKARDTVLKHVLRLKAGKIHNKIQTIDVIYIEYIYMYIYLYLLYMYIYISYIYVLYIYHNICIRIYHAIYIYHVIYI